MTINFENFSFVEEAEQMIADVEQPLQPEQLFRLWIVVLEAEPVFWPLLLFAFSQLLLCPIVLSKSFRLRVFSAFPALPVLPLFARRLLLFLPLPFTFVPFHVTCARYLPTFVWFKRFTVSLTRQVLAGLKLVINWVSLLPCPRAFCAQRYHPSLHLSQFS